MKDRKTEALLEELQKEIAYCSTCQPYDSGEVIWILGVERDLEDLFDRYKVPENIRDEIAESLHCSNCDRQMARYDTYGAKSESEKNAEQKYQEWLRKYGYDLDDFWNFIEKYPYLGAKHPLGQKIIKIMPKFPSTQIINSDWFRARKISDGRIFTHEDMSAPDPSKVPISEGRFNHFGQSHLYLANSELGAAKEINNTRSDEKLVWIQKVHIHNTSAILDVRVGFHEPDPDSSIIPTGLIYYSRVFSEIVDRDKYWKPEYFVPRFVADAAKLNGFQGIIFTSTQHYSDNLVLFDIKNTTYEFLDSPYIFKMPPEKHPVIRRPPSHSPPSDEDDL